MHLKLPIGRLSKGTAVASKRYTIVDRVVSKN